MWLAGGCKETPEEMNEIIKVNIKEGYPFEHHGKKALRLHEPQRFYFYLMSIKVLYQNQSQ